MGSVKWLIQCKVMGSVKWSSEVMGSVKWLIRCKVMGSVKWYIMKWLGQWSDWVRSLSNGVRVKWYYALTLAKRLRGITLNDSQSEVMRVKVKWGSEWSGWVRVKAGVKYYNGLKREWPDGVRFEWEWSDGVIVKEWRESQVSNGESRSRVMGSYWSKVWGETGGAKWEGRDGMKVMDSLWRNGERVK